ncbi:MAG: hypothetical protein ACFCVE_16015 [Phycisphaerae bacterium]
MRLVLCALALTPAFAEASTLYSQPPVISAQPLITTALGISDLDGGSIFAFANQRLADNFALTDPVEVDAVQFFGGSETFFGNSLSNIASINIEFFANVNGNAGASLFSESVPFADLNATQVPNASLGAFGGTAMYEFNAVLDTPAELPAGQYFISIAGITVNPVDFSNEAFQWAASASGDSLILVNSFDGNGFVPSATFANRNGAFTLQGRVVPEPTTAATMLMLPALLRRRSRSR